MSKAKTDKQTPDSSTPLSEEPARIVSEEDIAARAYALYLAQGEDGHDVANWLQAERELLEENSRDQALRPEETASSKVS